MQEGIYLPMKDPRPRPKSIVGAVEKANLPPNSTC